MSVPNEAAPPEPKLEPATAALAAAASTAVAPAAVVQASAATHTMPVPRAASANRREHVRVVAHEKRAPISLLPQSMGPSNGPMDFAQAWAVEDISEELFEASMLLHDCLFSTYANPNAYADNQALFDGVVKVLNDYAAAVEELLLGASAGEGTSEQRAQTARGIARRLKQMVTLRKRTQGGGRVEVRIGRKISAARIEKLKTALNSIADVIAEGETDGVEITEDPENDTTSQEEPSDAQPQIATTGPEAAQGNPSADASKAPIKQPPQIDTTSAQAATGDADRDPDKQRADGDAQTPNPELGEDEEEDDLDDELVDAIAALAQKLDALSAQVAALDNVSAPARAAEPNPNDSSPSSASGAPPAEPAVPGNKKPRVWGAQRQQQEGPAAKVLRSIEEKISQLGERVGRIENARRASAQAQLGTRTQVIDPSEPNGSRHQDEVFRGVLTRGLHMPMRLGDTIRRRKSDEG
jgi:hypothetical protein